MKPFNTRFLSLCALAVLAAASVAPFAASAQSCPDVSVECGGKIRKCSGTVNGDKCDYSKACLTCGSGGGEGGGISPIEPIQN